MKEESKLNLYLKKLWIAVCLTLILKKINYWHRKQSIEYLKKFWSKQTKIKTFLFCYKPLKLNNSNRGLLHFFYQAMLWPSSCPRTRRTSFRTTGPTPPWSWRRTSRWTTRPASGNGSRSIGGWKKTSFLQKLEDKKKPWFLKSGSFRRLNCFWEHFVFLSRSTEKVQKYLSLRFRNFF